MNINIRKFVLRVGVVAIMGIILISGCVQQEKTNKEQTEDKIPYQENGTTNLKEKTYSPIIIDVDNLAKDPEAYEGTIAVRGAVSFVYPSESSFIIIDLREYELCGKVTCAINHVQVSYSGELPKMRDKVLVIGEVSGTSGEYVLFKAKEVKKI